MFNYLYKINPVYKFAAVLILAVALAFTHSVALNTGAFLFCLILLATGSRKILSALKFLAPIMMMAAGLYITGANTVNTHNERVAEDFADNIIRMD